jgi:VWFA-related protein
LYKKLRRHEAEFCLDRQKDTLGFRGLGMKLHLLIVLLCATAALAQPPGSLDSQSPMLTTRTNLVLVPALVTTRTGEPVFTLTARDFVLTDDGIDQKATLDENSGSQPLALVIAIETGGAGARQLGKYRNLGPLIEAVIGNVQHKVALVGFDSQPYLLHDFTPDLNAISGAMRDLTPGDHGAGILDSLRFSVDLLREQPAAYRRAILIISETVDHDSRATLDETLHFISDTNTAIYSLGFSSAKSGIKYESSRIFQSSTPGPPKGCMSKDPNADPGSSGSRLEQAFDCLSLLAPPLRIAKMAAILGMDGLRRNVPESVAQLTGGEFFKFDDARSLERDMLAISHHLPNRYLLSFYPPAPHPGFHAIGLRLKDYPNLVVQARDGYWADSETPAAPAP